MKKTILLICLLLLAACESADLDEIALEAEAMLEEVETTVDETLTEVDEALAEVDEAVDAGAATIENNVGAEGGSEQVFRNGAIYTVNADQPWVDAVGVRDGQIVAVGTEDEVFVAMSESAEIIDLDGAMMLPGFQDTHVHLLEAGVNQQFCELERYSPPEAYVDLMIDCAAETEQEWVIGSGVNIARLLTQEEFPIALLDEAVPDRPALILDDLGHGAWANTLAMQAVGYDSLEGQPQGGMIDRDESGALTGIVLENAQQPLRTAALTPSAGNLRIAYDGMADTLYFFGQNGITSMSDAGGYWTRGHHEVWQRVADEDNLTLRAHNALYVFPNMPLEPQIAQITALYSNDDEQLLRFNTVKIYLDGIVSQGTGAFQAAYSEPFGLPGVPQDGFLYFDDATLKRYSAELDAAGFQLHYHVTGDKGAKMALDAIEHAQNVNGNTGNRHRLTHLYVVDSADFPRFAQLGVGADFQLSADSLTDDYYDSVARLVGEVRAENLLPAFALREAGATVSISSDFDAGELSPLDKMQTILTAYGEGAPELAVLIEMMTINPAYHLNQDTTTGSIEVGKWADFAVLDQNLFDVSPNQLSNVSVLATYLEGELVYSIDWE